MAHGVLWNHHRSFEWCHRWPPTIYPSPKMGSKMHPRTNLVTYAAIWWIWQKVSTRFLLHMSDVAFCQITLALVNKQSVASIYESILHILGLLKEYRIYQTAKQHLCRKYYRWHIYCKCWEETAISIKWRHSTHYTIVSVQLSHFHIATISELLWGAHHKSYFLHSKNPIDFSSPKILEYCESTPVLLDQQIYVL